MKARSGSGNLLCVTKSIPRHLYIYIYIYTCNRWLICQICWNGGHLQSWCVPNILSLVVQSICLLWQLFSPAPLVLRSPMPPAAIHPYPMKVSSSTCPIGSSRLLPFQSCFNRLWQVLSATLCNLCHRLRCPWVSSLQRQAIGLPDMQMDIHSSGKLPGSWKETWVVSCK